MAGNSNVHSNSRRVFIRSDMLLLIAYLLAAVVVIVVVVVV